MTSTKWIYNIGMFDVQLCFKNVHDVKMIQLLIQLVKDCEIRKKAVKMYSELMSLDDIDEINGVDIFIMLQVYCVQYTCFFEEVIYFG